MNLHIEPIPDKNELESVLQQDLIKTVKKLDGYIITNTATETTGSGKPDLSACINSTYYALEVKRRKGPVKTKFNQIFNLCNVAKAKGNAYLVKTIDVLHPDILKLYNKELLLLPQGDFNDTQYKKVITKFINDYLKQDNVRLIQYRMFNNTYMIEIYYINTLRKIEVS